MIAKARAGRPCYSLGPITDICAMNLEEKLRQLKKAAEKSNPEIELERQLEHLRKIRGRPEKSLASSACPSGGRKPLPAQRAAHGIEAYVDGRVEQNELGEFFSARQALPFGRPYGKLRIGDLATSDLSPLNLFLSSAMPETSRLMFLDTETTGLAGGTGTCAFLIGLGAVEGSQFVVRQFFLRDYPEERAMLAELAEVLGRYQGLVTFNGKTFDAPLLETRYALARMESPFERLLHLDLLHPARRLWKLRLESCALGHLETEVLGVHREGDVDGSEIPGIYFDYLRSGNARGLQPVFYHNALDIISLAALTVEMAGVIGAHSGNGEGAATDGRGATSSLDLYSLSRIFERSGARDLSISKCRQALASGLPQSVETHALWQLASQHKRRNEPERAVELWLEVTRRDTTLALRAFEELAIYYEHRQRDSGTALEYAERALRFLDSDLGPAPMRARHAQRFSHRVQRLRKKAEARSTGVPPVLV